MRTAHKHFRSALRDGQPLCISIGDMNLVRALGVAGIPVGACVPPSDPSRFSRHVRVALEWVDPESRPDDLAAHLEAFARTQAAPPVVMPQTDAALLALSRRRERLGRSLRLSLASHDLVEALVDKASFQKLAESLELPVPPTRVLAPGAPEPLDLRYPVIIKPLTRSAAWASVESSSKARIVTDSSELARLRATMGDLELLAQEAIPGPETRIESYHVYADEDGDVVADFTGRKIRTYPARFGFSTAVEITDSPDVRAAGREATERLELTGVAKFDFKRSAEGRLHLLEVNPRFSLWHYPGALAGVNLPALVYADLVGVARPPLRKARAGVTWCQPLEDLKAAREDGEPLWRWLKWFAGCDARSSLSLSDPRPFVIGRLLPTVRAKFSPE